MNASDSVAEMEPLQERVEELFEAQHQSIIQHTDQLFSVLMVLQWFVAVGLALWVSPVAWSGMSSHIHPHVWLAVIIGGVITSLPVYLARFDSGKPLTRHVIAVGQMLMSALLIHLTGGRMETHFHIFGSLAILAFYRDWKVLISATVVVYVDHLLRGIFWPQSVYGVLTSQVWRSFEHGGWLIFEVAFLLISVRKSLEEMRITAERQASLEALKAGIQQTVAERTAELTKQISERRQVEADLHQSQTQLAQSQKMEAVGRLAGGVAHDFNNLLTVITGYCALCLHEIGPRHPTRKHIEEIHKSAERAAALTAQLLAFSRKQVLRPRVLNLSEVAKGMETMLRRLIGEDVELSISTAADLGRIKADPGQLEQVILNLVVNARDAMPRGGKLTVRTSNITLAEASSQRDRVLQAGNYVLLEIADSGVGMSEDVKEHLFEPFFTTKGMGKGTGLGLATTYGIICQSDGDIRVVSEPNAGTTFKIYLPRIDAALEPAAKAETNLPQGNESILIVEDDPAVRRLAVTILRARGYRIQESSSAIEALELLKANPRFDLVISDVIMPQMSGKALCDRIKAQSPDSRVLLMSGYTDDALARHGALEEGLLFLEKPFSPAKLAGKVREILDSPTSRNTPPAADRPVSIAA